MMVLLNKEDGTRYAVNAELIKDKATTVLVRLPDGKIITRKKKRDIPQGE